MGASFDGSIVEWETESGAELRRWTAHGEAGCHSASLSADGTRLLSTAWDGSVRLWKVMDGSAAGVFKPEGGGCYDCELSPDGTRAAATHGDRVSVWDAATGELLHEFEAGGRTSGLAFDAAGARLAVACGTCGADGRLGRFELDGSAESRILYEADEALLNLSWSPDGSRIAVTSEFLTVVVRGMAACCCRPIRIPTRPGRLPGLVMGIA